MKFAVGTTNRAKLESVRMAVARCSFVGGAAALSDATRAASSDGGESDGHDRHEIVGVATESGVSAQPFSAAETRRGALARAMGALAGAADADFGIGLEGGIEAAQGDESGVMFECGWMCVVERATGRIGWGSSARFLLDGAMVAQLRAGKELAEVIDDMTGERDVRSNLGARGILTGGALGRAEAYMHGLLFAFAPFLSDAKFWVATDAAQRAARAAAAIAPATPAAPSS
jgi:inosine/xanthosine triphosphatase